MSTTYSVTAGQLINASARLQGFTIQGGTPPAVVVTTMLEGLNILVKAWSSRGLKVWRVQEQVIPLTTMPRFLQLGPTATSPPGIVMDRPLRIEECFIRYNPTSQTPADVSLQALSRNEYDMLGNKFSSGTPNSYYYDQQIPNGILYLYVVPDSLAAGFEVHILARKQISDIASTADTLDFPSEWYQALKHALADETALENQIPESVADRISAKASQYREEMEDWDREYTSVFFQPDQRRQRN